MYNQITKMLMKIKSKQVQINDWEEHFRKINKGEENTWIRHKKYCIRSFL